MQQDIAEFIQNLRHDTRLTQKEFGSLMGVTQNIVSLWERGELEPNEYKLTIMKQLRKKADDKASRERLKNFAIAGGLIAFFYWLFNQEE